MRVALLWMLAGGAGGIVGVLAARYFPRRPRPADDLAALVSCLMSTVGKLQSDMARHERVILELSLRATAQRSEIDRMKRMRWRITP